MAIDETAPRGSSESGRAVRLRGLDVWDFRDHLNMTPDEAADGHEFWRLILLLESAVAHVGADLGFPIDDAAEFPDGTPADVRQAVFMLAAHWFSQREATVVGVSMAAVPFGYAEIIANHRSWVFG